MAVAPANGQVLVRSLWSLISPGTELALYTGTHVSIENPANSFAKYPFYPGYAAVGEVVAVGPDVRGLSPGKLVYTRGRHALFNTLQIDDPAGPVLPLPENCSAEYALFARLAAISMTAVSQSRPMIGALTVVLGAGLIGNLAAQLLALAGARVVVVDVATNRLATARACGLYETVLSAPGTRLEQSLTELAGQGQPDLVVEATGVPELIPQALELVRPLGQVVALGSTRGKVDLDVYELIHRKGVRLSGAHEMIQMQPGYPSKLAMTRHVLWLISTGALKIEPLITHRLPFDQALAGYQMLLEPKSGALGVLLDWKNCK